MSYIGIKQGTETAKRDGEQKRNYEIAKSMKEDGFTTDMISKQTGLSHEEIEKL